MGDLEILSNQLREMQSALLGYSGGVDSAVLAVAGVRAFGPDRFLAVIGRSASYPEAQYQSALELTRRFSIPLLEVKTDELDDPDYIANRPDRCYFCKSELWNRLGSIASERGFAVVLDGTNADDLSEHRPGMRAAREHAIRSPLADLAWSKARVRECARALGIPTWDAPASPCLSSRIRYGLAVTPARLLAVEEAEARLRSMGVTGDMRVRHHGDFVRIEVDPGLIQVLEAHWSEIVSSFEALGLPDVRLDPRGYRRGGLLAELPVVG